MKLRVQYMAQLGAAIGRSEEHLEVPDGCSLSEMLVRLAALHETSKQHLVTEAGMMRPSLLVIVNDAAVPARDAARTVLHDGDTVTMLPPIAGG